MSHVPRVKTNTGEYHPDRVVKKEWGVIMIDGRDKRSIPWHHVQAVVERMPAEDAPGPLAQTAEMKIAGDGGEVIE